ncbi:MAG: FAD-dependent oxidoreductase [Promethearchaeota archaeon]
MEKVGAVLIVGGGIGGTQAALDLNDSGFKVYVVEKSTGIGGVMSQLDKTFPTNDCSMCILSPKLVEAGRARNVTLLVNSEVTKVEGMAGNFQVTVLKHPLYIDAEKCTGCGVCAAECPVEAIDFFNEGLCTLKATSVKYPQAVPLVYAINRELCIGCGACRGACKANAVDYFQEPEEVNINVGAIILAPGFDEFEPEGLSQYGYGKYKNVVTSIEFERILSASGPYKGSVLRPSDGDIPEKVAFLQCVGSRNCKLGREYCSSVCCMYTAKEAVIAKEHQHQVNPTIFCMDIRAYGKDFDKYIERAKDEYGVRYIRSRISSIEEDPITRDLLLAYEDDQGNVVEEQFNMVVLAVGFDPPKEGARLAQIMEVELNKYGFVAPGNFTPVETNIPGIYVCGAFASPKDIPETVTEASAAAGMVNVLLSEARGQLVSAKEYPEEIFVQNQPPRIGVFVCHCGINIGGVVDVPAVTEYASNLDNVVIADRNLYTCSADTQEIIKEKVKEYDLNRVVVASCTPRTHEPLFQETIREAGLNPYLFQMTNIRDQDSWVHMHEPEAATEKAKDLVRMAIAAARGLEPLKRLRLELKKKALVIGGGVAGMNAAIRFGEMGYESCLVEKEGELGGFARNVYSTIEGRNVQKYLRKLIEKVRNTPGVRVYTNAEIKAIDGFVGNFETTLVHGPNDDEVKFEHGVVVVATGALEYQPREFLYGKNPKVIKQSEFEKMLHTNPSSLDAVDTVVMIQCVGSRNEEHPYCSRMCCQEAIKNATIVKEIHPETNVVVLYRDIRTYGFKELNYREAREMGVLFIRFDRGREPQVEAKDDGLVVRVETPRSDEVAIKSDLVVLSTGIVAREDSETLAQMLKVPLNDDKFFLEAHVKLRPVDFATEGVFVAGMAHSPKPIENAIAQSLAAVSRACTILSRDYIETEGKISVVREDRCVGCGLCVSVCAYNAIALSEEEGKATINEALCKGCGACAATCRCSAIDVMGFTNEEIYNMIVTKEV